MQTTKTMKQRNIMKVKTMLSFMIGIPRARKILPRNIWHIEEMHKLAVAEAVERTTSLPRI